MPGAQVTSQVRIYDLRREVVIHLQVRNETTGRLVHDGLQRVSAPAVTPGVTMTSAPLTLENHSKYKAIVFIQVPRESGNNEVRNSVAEIGAIKWTFGP